VGAPVPQSGSDVIAVAINLTDAVLRAFRLGTTAFGPEPVVPSAAPD